jgi:small subunit ribosomal protein S20
MPHTKSAEKRHRQYEKNRIRNKTRIRTISKLLKTFDAAVKTGDAAAVQTAYNDAAGKLDKAAAKRTIHPNAAARKKSQLAKKLFAKKAGKV